MTLYSAVGNANALDGREAGMQATHQALNQLGTSSLVLAIVLAPYRYDAQQVVSGVSSLTGNAPVIGMSTSATLTSDGQHPQSVVVVLFGGEDIEAESHWFAGYSQGSQETAERLINLAHFDRNPAKSMIMFADGFNGDAEQFCASLPADFPLMGGLSAGDLHTGLSYQMAGVQSGTSGLVIAILRGVLKTGIGYGHGWNPVGSRYRITRSRVFWLRTLDGRPASETYAALFGYPARDWAFPPLNHMTRVYPLGLEQGADRELLVRAPLRVEADGSFRMNAGIRDGSDAYLLVASPTSCIKSAQQAAEQAKRALGNARPRMAMVFVDLAWQMLMQAQPGAEIKAVQEVIGADIPIAGCYTLGQVVPANEQTSSPQFLNQHIVVTLFGEPQA